MVRPARREPAQADAGARPASSVSRSQPVGTAAAAAKRSSSLPYQSGDIIADKYQLTSVIGEGGMGSVWRARNVVLNVDVAVKLVNRDRASATAAQRLLIEARSAARLIHPSIVRVNDFGTTARDDPFIVMELLQGESLADVLGRKDFLPAVNAVQMLLPIVSALATAHAEGIVHRDLKPENIILVTGHGGVVVPKLVDFGIAKMTHEEDEPSFEEAEEGAAAPSPELRRRLTLVGQLTGSPDYVSPEQARGDPDIDERADLWSVSVVLYEMICGGSPFKGVTVEELLFSILVAEPAPTTTFAGGDEALWEIIKRGLTKPRAGRWQSAQAMGEALARWLATQGVDTDITGTSIRRPWLSGTPARPYSLAPPQGERLEISIPTDALRLPGLPPRAAGKAADEPTAAPEPSAASQPASGELEVNAKTVLIAMLVGVLIALPLVLVLAWRARTAQPALPVVTTSSAVDPTASDAPASAAPTTSDAPASAAPTASEEAPAAASSETAADTTAAPSSTATPPPKATRKTSTKTGRTSSRK